MNEVKDQEEPFKTRTLVLPFLAIGASVVVILAGVGLASMALFESWEIRGQFGDSFGVANSLFSGLAFAALIYTIHLQRNELSLQRKELELTRIELNRTASAQEASERALTKQTLALKTAAKLNAYSSLIEHYSVKIQSMSAASQRFDAEQLQLTYIAKLEGLLPEVEDS